MNDWQLVYTPDHTTYPFVIVNAKTQQRSSGMSTLRNLSFEAIFKGVFPTHILTKFRVIYSAATLEALIAELPIAYPEYFI